jgi:hypothetical protein
MLLETRFIPTIVSISKVQLYELSYSISSHAFSSSSSDMPSYLPSSNTIVPLPVILDYHALQALESI